MSEDSHALLDELDAAATAVEAAREDLEAIGEDRLETLDDACTRFERLLGTYESRATGTGDFRAFVEFQNELAAFVEGLPDDLPRREAFETAEDAFDKRRLSERDFETARDALADARELAARIAARDDAVARYRDARRAVDERLREIDAELAALERVLELGAVDLDAPVDELLDPVQTYDDAVSAAFDDFLHEASTRTVFSFLERTRSYPLVPFEPPPDDLARFVSTHEAGELPLTKLLEYADYSRSKLDHYVDDADALKRTVAAERTYLDAIGPEPLCIDWPPPPADVLRWRIRELIAVVDRFAPSTLVAHLREIRELAADEARYERLRQDAMARHELDEHERERLRTGAVEREVAELDDERERLRAALDSSAP